MTQPPVGPYAPQPRGGVPYQPPVPGYPQQPPGGHPPGPAGPYGGMPPGPAGPYGGMPPAPGRRPVGPILLVVLAVVLVLCVGGAAVTFFVAKNVKEAVDITRVRVVEPETLAGRPKVVDPNLRRTSSQFEADLRGVLPEVTSTVHAFYGDRTRRDLVMVVAASGLNPEPTTTLDEVIAGARRGPFQIGEMSPVDPGPAGGAAKCGDAIIHPARLGVCAWSDRGSVGLVFAYFSAGDAVRQELATIRDQVVRQP